MSPSKRVKRSTSPPVTAAINVDEAEKPAIESSKEDDVNLDDLGAIDEAILDEEDGEDVPKKPGFSGGFNALKSFNGQVYSGMAIGGSHTWNYDEGVWKETKKEPDLWEINYKTDKHRSHSAPKGSGAPVGTEYHWFIVAHQMVKKLDANTYSTHLTGSKYKLAHKGASASTWNINTVKKQREREVFLLQDAIKRVEGLPPVLSSEKIKSKDVQKGQKTLDGMFKSSPVKSSPEAGDKRKR